MQSSSSSYYHQDFISIMWLVYSPYMEHTRVAKLIYRSGPLLCFRLMQI